MSLTPVPSDKAEDLLLNVRTIDQFTTGTALTATDRLGNSKPTLAGLREQYPNAEPAAATATAQAGIAITQGVLATAAKDGAEAAAVTAQNAAITAAAAAKAYGSITAANADTGLAIGQSFTAPLADGSLQTYTKTASSGSAATAIGEPLIGAALLNARLSDVVNGELPTLRNIFSKNDATDNFALRSTDGVAVSATGYFTTPFIKVIPGGQFILNKAIYGSGVYGVAYYSAAKGFLSGSNTAVAANTAVTVPTTAFFARFSVLTLANKAGLIMVHGAALPTSFAEHDFTEAYAQRGLLNTGLSELIRPVPNLFRPSAVTLDTVVSSTTGATSAATNFFCTEFMRVSPGTVTCDTTATSLGAANGWAFYDSARSFISGVSGPVTANTAVSVPLGAAYARLSMHNFPTGNPRVRYSMQVWQGATAPTEYQGVNYADAPSVVRLAQATVRNYLPANWNLFVKSAVTTAQALLITGVIDTSGAYATYCVTGYMPVRPGVAFSANQGLAFGSLLGWVYYDKDLNYLSGVAGGTYTAGTGITPPAAAAYMRTSWLTNQIVRLKINEGTTTPAETYGFDDLRQLYKYAGVKMSAGGDSIMATIDGSNVFYLELLNRLKCATGINAAVSGYRMHQMWTVRTASEFADTGLFIWHAGTNDYFVTGTGALPPTPIGSLTDAPATGASASFIAAVKYNIENLLGVNPNMRIMFLAPMQRFTGVFGGNGTDTNILGHTLLDYTDALIATAALYGCPVYDQARRNGINAVNQSVHLVDGLHPTTLGYTQRAIPGAVSFINAN